MTEVLVLTCLEGRVRGEYHSTASAKDYMLPILYHIHTHRRVYKHFHRLVSPQQDTPNRDGRVLWQIEMPVNDKVGMDWLPCPCHVAPSASNREEDRWIPTLAKGWMVQKNVQDKTQSYGVQ